MVTIEAPSDPSLLCSKLDYAAEKQKVLNINALGFEFYHSLWPLNLPVINYILLPSRKNKLSDGQFTLHMQNSSLRSKTLAGQIPLFYFLGDGEAGWRTCLFSSIWNSWLASWFCSPSQLVQSDGDLTMKDERPLLAVAPTPPPLSRKTRGQWGAAGIAHGVGTQAYLDNLLHFCSCSWRLDGTPFYHLIATFSL